MTYLLLTLLPCLFLGQLPNDWQHVFLSAKGFDHKDKPKDEAENKDQDSKDWDPSDNHHHNEKAEKGDGRLLRMKLHKTAFLLHDQKNNPRNESQ